MTELISENKVHYDTCDSNASQVWQIQHARAPNSPLLNCLTGAKQNHCRKRKMELAGRCAEGRGRGEVGGSAVWEKCYNSELLSGVRSLNYSEMWTACQCWGLSQSCGQHHTHYTLLCPVLLVKLPYISIHLLVCPFVCPSWSFMAFHTCMHAANTCRRLLKQKIGWPIQISHWPHSLFANVPLNCVLTVTSGSHESWPEDVFMVLSLKINLSEPQMGKVDSTWS